MKYLLDTCTLIWYFEKSHRLSPKTRELVNRDEHRVYLCSVSFLEIAIKVSSGKLELRLPFEEFLDEIGKRDFEILQIENEHLKKLVFLPFHHKDPFDRVMIATALAENLTIITADEDIHKYDVPWTW